MSYDKSKKIKLDKGSENDKALYSIRKCLSDNNS